MDSALLTNQGWHPRIALPDGIARAYAAFLRDQPASFAATP